MKYTTDTRWAMIKTMTECAGFYDKLEYLESPHKVEYYENGLKMRFRFTGLNEDPGQFEIVSSDIDPLS